MATENISHTAILVGGGTGTRLNRGLPKAFVPLAGEPLLYWTMLALSRWPHWREWVCLVPQGCEDKAREVVEKIVQIRWPVLIQAGGSTRHESALKGLSLLESDTYAWVHDVARPFVSVELLNRIRAKLKNHSTCVIPVLPFSSTVKKIENKKVIQTIDRSTLRISQTPQAAPADVLSEALEWCAQRNIEVTDEAQAFEFKGYDVEVVEGDRWNVKITYPEDLWLGEWICSWFFSEKFSST